MDILSEKNNSNKCIFFIQQRHDDMVYGLMKQIKLVKDRKMEDVDEIEKAEEDEEEENEDKICEELKVFDLNELPKNFTSQSNFDKKLIKEEGIAGGQSISDHLIVRMVQFEYQIIFSESYSVPVLYFRAINDRK